MLGKKLTIIGGSGGMGKIFGYFFKKNGFEVSLNARNLENLKRVAQELDVNFESSLEDSVKDADIVLISLPITSTPNMIQNVAPFLKKNALLIDITSLKTKVINSMEKVIKIYPINCLSLHPMFGPGIKDMKNYVMIVLRVGGIDKFNDLVNELVKLLEDNGLIITETTPELHDKRIALTLGVPHMLNILFLNLIRRSREPLTELTRYTGTTFLLQKVFAESIIQRERDMFAHIQLENQEFYDVINKFESLIKEYKKIVQNKDFDKFNRVFGEALEYSKEDDHFKDSYRYFYEFMKILKE
ncbi:MAG: prephenate dehydrogenase/arogenate dehydrogenase family protein [Candidatus Lokiarchaeia archaeon]|nr:prephenate dehydrogenase/arogenate dehydrogenase family protein [Candidatus Lokiarchaeia archaeon]